MLRTLITACVFVLALNSVTLLSTTAESAIQVAQGKSLTDAEVRKEIIRQSIAGYSGNCACPYNRSSNGSKCGKRSAWSKPGGASPLCYADDVSDQMVKRFRQQGR
jgi:hypothetical protein